MANYRNGYLDVGGPVSQQAMQVNLLADNTLIDISNAALVVISSDSVTATNRTFTLSTPTIGNQHLNLVFISGSSYTCQLVNGGNCQLSTDWLPTQYQSLELQYEVTTGKWIELGRNSAGSLASASILVGNSSNQAAAVALSGDATLANTGALTLAPAVYVRTAALTVTRANILAMYVTPVNLIATPGAGKIIVIDEIELFHDYATAAYADGGDLVIQYTGTTQVVQIAAAIATETADSTRFIVPSLFNIDNSTGSTPVSSAGLANKGIDITNLTQAFTGGNASNIIKLAIRYHVYTLLT